MAGDPWMTLTGKIDEASFACEEQLREFISLVVNKDMATFCGGLPLTAPFVKLHPLKRDEHYFKRSATHGHGRCFGWGLASLKLQLGAKTGRTGLYLLMQPFVEIILCLHAMV